MVFGKIGETSQHILLITPLIQWVNKFQFALETLTFQVLQFGIVMAPVTLRSFQ